MLKLMCIEWRWMFNKESLFEANARVFTALHQHAASLKSPTIKMRNTMKNSNHLNLSEMPDWYPAIGNLITEILSNSATRSHSLSFKIQLLIRFQVPRLSRSLLTIFSKEEAKAKSRGWTKQGIYFVRDAGWAFVISTCRKQTKKAPFFFSLLVWLFGLALIRLYVQLRNWNYSLALVLLPTTRGRWTSRWIDCWNILEQVIEPQLARDRWFLLFGTFVGSAKHFEGWKENIGKILQSSNCPMVFQFHLWVEIISMMFWFLGLCVYVDLHIEETVGQTVWRTSVRVVTVKSQLI